MPVAQNRNQGEAPMQELIERLEKATGPDREVDRDIELALERGVFQSIKHPDDVWDNHHRPGRAPIWPAYTASIDAALTLVPDGCGFAIDTRPRNDPAYRLPLIVAWVSEFADKPCVPMIGATPAIALCIAALKARQAIAR